MEGALGQGRGLHELQLGGFLLLGKGALQIVGLDDAYTAMTGGYAEVRSRGGGARLWFDEAFGYAQVFTLEDVTPGRHGVAIEPMTCPPDAFNSGEGLIVLEPGAAWTGRWGITPV